jgi:diketogulonate reductase-like aldo/keto reductase
VRDRTSAPDTLRDMKRRHFISSSIASVAVASSTWSRATLAQAQARTPIMKSAPRLRESLPAIGLGTFLAFDRLPGEPREDLEAVMRQFWDAGGRVVDTSPLYGMGEVNVGDLAARLGISDQLFITNKIWSTGEYLGDRSHAQRSLENSMQRLWRKQIDVMMCHSLVNADIVVPLLKTWRHEGRIRYAGVSHHELAAFPALADWVERGDLDVVQVHYSIGAREAEQRILPAAAERGMAVMVNMPFEKGRLFKLVEGRALPDFAREVGVQSWGQYFLKWIASHPATTCVLPATANPRHAADNMGALFGPLPDQAMRARMLRHMESIPGFGAVTSTAPYPGRKYPGVIERARQPG